MKNRLLTLSLLLCLGVMGAQAQKVFRPIRVAFKAKNPQTALAEVKKAEEKCPETLRPKLFAYGVEACVQLNDQLNEKIYLRQAYDTAQFFRTIHDVYLYALRCDTAERRLLATEGTPLKYQKIHGQILRKYYRNLSAGGRYFFTRERYAEAIPLLRYAVDVPTLPLWGQEGRPLRRQTYVANAVMLVRSAFLTKDYALVKQYADVALEDTTVSRRSILAYLARTYQVTGDTTNYVLTLKRGVQDYPLEPFYFSELVDHYASHGDFLATLRLADEMLPVDSSNYFFLMAKALSLVHLERNAEAIDYFQRALEADSTYDDTYYYIGAAYTNLARTTKIPPNITSSVYAEATQQRRSYYEQALPPLETYRQRRPDDAKRWVPLLYDIYFALNMGEKFEEIDRIMQSLGTR